ncbi:MAG: TetR/AcrR family transcriptional regulator [Erysipelotrichaceae bacterium]|nr:TetR/AcrR family transcriptional regulator [Erysipelotrichaceae bacterium]
MRKNTEAQTRQKLENIQNTALKLFIEKGMDQVSVSEICKAAGITKPTFYKYIDSKEKIILNYFQEVQGPLEEQWAVIGDSEDHLGRVIVAAAASLVHVETVYPELFKKYVSYCLSSRIPIERYEPEAVMAIEREIRLAQEAGQIGLEADSSLIYGTLKNMGLGMVMRWITKPDQLNLKGDFLAETAAFLDIDSKELPRLAKLLEELTD